MGVYGTYGIEYALRLKTDKIRVCAIVCGECENANTVVDQRFGRVANINTIYL